MRIYISLRRHGCHRSIAVVLSFEVRRNDMKIRMLVYLTAAVLVAFLALSAPGAQSGTAKGSLHGIVTDPSGAAIPGASVFVSDGHGEEEVATNETGQYTVPGLAPGHYRVQIHSAGFSAFEKSGLVISAGYETEGDAQLVLSAVKNEITVRAGPLD
jgi:carboxypeptidase family protein